MLFHQLLHPSPLVVVVRVGRRMIVTFVSFVRHRSCLCLVGIDGDWRHRIHSGLAKAILKGINTAVEVSNGRVAFVRPLQCDAVPVLERGPQRVAREEAASESPFPRFSIVLFLRRFYV
jgi:hypothetical protein